VDGKDKAQPGSFQAKSIKAKGGMKTMNFTGIRAGKVISYAPAFYEGNVILKDALHRMSYVKFC